MLVLIDNEWKKFYDQLTKTNDSLFHVIKGEGEGSSTSIIILDNGFKPYVLQNYFKNKEECSLF